MKNSTKDNMPSSKLLDAVSTIIVISLVAGAFLGFSWIVRQGLTYTSEIGNNDKIEYFENGNTLICHSEMFSSKKYLVSREHGWKIYKNQFQKKDLLIPIAKCEEE